MTRTRPVHHGGACLLFAIEGVVLTWPLVLHVSDAVPGEGPGDNVAFLWNLWWMRHARSVGASFFRTNYLFHPFGTDLILHTHTALNAFVAATALGGLSIVAAQNILILTSYALNGICVYALAWRVTQQTAAAVTAGVVFMAAPFFAAHLHGHFNLLSAWFIPVYATLLLSALEKRSTWRAACAGAVLAACAYSDYYYVVFLLVFTAWTVGYRWLTASVHRAPFRPPMALPDWLLIAAAAALAAAGLWIRLQGGGVFSIGTARVSMTSDANVRVAMWLLLLALAWRRLGLRVRFAHAPDATRNADVGLIAVVAAVFAAAASPVLVRAIDVWRRGDYVSQTYYWRSGPFGIDALSLVAGNPFHPVWGALVRGWYSAWGTDLIEDAAWIGVVPIAAAVIIVRARQMPAVARFWAGVGGLFLLWALGPSLILAGRHVGLWLPEVLIRFVPIVSNARIPGRAMVMVYLALALLCAIGVSMVSPRKSRQVAALLCVVALTDFWSAPFPLLRLDRPDVYARLATEPSGATLELPLGLRDGRGVTGSLDPATLYYQTLHEHPIAGGFVARLAPSVSRQYEAFPVLRALLSLSAGVDATDLPDRETCARFLRESGFRYVVMNTRLSPRPLQDYVRVALPVRLVSSGDDRSLYVIE